MAPSAPLPLMIITGYSGSGKSTALDAFEDAGFFCVDNLPVALLPKFLELPLATTPDIAGFAFVMDLREKGFLTTYRHVFDRLSDNGYPWTLIFLSTDEDVLHRRYSETRRHHPLGHGARLLDAIRAERRLLEPLLDAAHHRLDTTRYSVHQLKDAIRRLVTDDRPCRMQISLMSFGFKFGIPPEADLVVDVRFLPNPHFDPALRPMSGEDPAVSDYVFNHPDTRTFFAKYLDLLDYLIPLYQKEGKAYLTVAVGCTGGRHRSVALACAFHDRLTASGYTIGLTHRDIGSAPPVSSDTNRKYMDTHD